MFKKIKSALNKSYNKLKSSKINMAVKKVTGFCKKIYDYVYQVFNVAGKTLAKKGVSANLVSIIGFAIGLLGVNFLSMEMYGYALLCILLNRVFDAIDGAIAKASKITDFGIFLDSTLDYVFYAAVIFGFALANPERNAVAAVFLIFAFATSAFAMLSFAVVAYKNNLGKKVELNQSPFYFGGWAQGFETLIALVVLCLVPIWFVPIALLLGVLCFIKALSVVVTAYYSFVISVKNK